MFSLPEVDGLPLSCALDRSFTTGTLTVTSSADLLSKHPKHTQRSKHTTMGIRWWSPTQLIHRSEACVWQSGRDAQFSPVYGVKGSVCELIQCIECGTRPAQVCPKLIDRWVAILSGLWLRSHEAPRLRYGVHDSEDAQPLQMFIVLVL
jgi:hypothetical protein